MTRNGSRMWEPVAEGESDDRTLTLTTERVDDIPLLLAQLERMGLQPLLTSIFPPMHWWLELGVGERALADSYSLGG